MGIAYKGVSEEFSCSSIFTKEVLEKLGENPYCTITDDTQYLSIKLDYESTLTLDD